MNCRVLVAASSKTHWHSVNVLDSRVNGPVARYRSLHRVILHWKYSFPSRSTVVSVKAWFLKVICEMMITCLPAQARSAHATSTNAPSSSWTSPRAKLRTSRRMRARIPMPLPSAGLVGKRAAGRERTNSQPRGVKKSLGRLLEAVGKLPVLILLSLLDTVPNLTSVLTDTIAALRLFGFFPTIGHLAQHG